jgi:hypothetical protein
MATATELSKKKRKSAVRKRKAGSSWAVWVCLLAGILATPVAVRAASILALSGPNALTMLFPFMQIVKNPVLRVPGNLANPAAQALMYLQFPLYGLLLGRLLRTRSLITALGAVAFLHVAGMVSAYLLMHVQNPYLSF